MNGPCAEGEMLLDFGPSVFDIIPQFFLGSQFHDVSVVLDNNYFVRNAFDGVTFKYMGTGKPFLRENKYTNCVVELPEGVSSEGLGQLLADCRFEIKEQVAVEGAVGLPMQLHQEGTRMVLPIR